MHGQHRHTTGHHVGQVPRSRTPPSLHRAHGSGRAETRGQPSCQRRGCTRSVGIRDCSGAGTPAPAPAIGLPDAVTRMSRVAAGPGAGRTRRPALTTVNDDDCNSGRPLAGRGDHRRQLGNQRGDGENSCGPGFPRCRGSSPRPPHRAACRRDWAGRRSWPTSPTTPRSPHWPTASSGWTCWSTTPGAPRACNPVAEANLDDWRWMWETNVIGTLRVTRALLPQAGRVRRRPDRHGDLDRGPGGLRRWRGLHGGQSMPRALCIALCAVNSWGSRCG